MSASVIVWKGETRTLDQLAAGVESLRVDGQPILSPVTHSDVLDGDGIPAIVSGNAPPVGNLT